MQLNPAEISELLKSKIQNLEVSADSRNQGTVVAVTDGIVRIHGLSDVMQGEMIEFPGNVFGLALNLCLLYTSPSPRDRTRSRMPSSA